MANKEQKQQQQRITAAPTEMIWLLSTPKCHHHSIVYYVTELNDFCIYLVDTPKTIFLFHTE